MFAGEGDGVGREGRRRRRHMMKKKEEDEEAEFRNEVEG